MIFLNQTDYGESARRHEISFSKDSWHDSCGQQNMHLKRSQFVIFPRRQAKSAKRRAQSVEHQVLSAKRPAARIRLPGSKHPLPHAMRRAPRVIKRRGAVLSRLALKSETVTLASIRVAPPIAVPTIGRRLEVAAQFILDGGQ